MFFFCFFCFFQATILQLPRIFVKDDAQAADAAGGAAEAAGARPAKPVAARLELEGENRLPEGASWRFGEPGDEACRMGGTGWYRQVTITEKEGGVERKTNLTLPSYVWVGGETAKWPQAAEGVPPSGRSRPSRGLRRKGCRVRVAGVGVGAND